MKKISACKGFWVQDKNGQDYSDLDDFQKIYLSCQNHQVALVKYNFIHLPAKNITKIAIYGTGQNEVELSKQILL